MNNLIQLNKMLVLVTTVLGLTFCSLMAQANSDRGSRPSGKPPGPEHLVTELGISDQNKDAFLDIMKAAHEKRRAIHQQYRSTREEQREAMDKLHNEVMGQLADVLDENQLSQFEQFVKSRKPPRRR